MKRFLLLLVCLLLSASTALAGAFEKTGGSGRNTVIGEVTGFGEYDVLPQFMEGLQDAAWSNLQESKDFRLAGLASDAELMHLVHKNAIVNGHLYNRGTSNAELINYGRAVLGANYRPTEAEYQAKLKQAGMPYRLSSEVAEALRDYALAEGVEYVVFLNFNYMEMWLRDSIFNVSTTADLRGKSATTEIDYYLVNAYTGQVYDGHSSEKKTAQMMNVLWVTNYGKGMPVNNMIFGIMDSHMKKIMKKLTDEGLKRV